VALSRLFSHHSKGAAFGGKADVVFEAEVVADRLACLDRVWFAREMFVGHRKSLKCIRPVDRLLGEFATKTILEAGGCRSCASAESPRFMLPPPAERSLRGRALLFDRQAENYRHLAKFSERLPQGGIALKSPLFRKLSSFKKDAKDKCL